MLLRRRSLPSSSSSLQAPQSADVSIPSAFSASNAALIDSTILSINSAIFTVRPAITCSYSSFVLSSSSSDIAPEALASMQGLSLWQALI